MSYVGAGESEADGQVAGPGDAETVGVEGGLAQDRVVGAAVEVDGDVVLLDGDAAGGLPSRF